MYTPREQPDGQHSRPDLVHLLANRLYFSRFYSALYLFMIVANIVIIVWMFSMPGGYDGNFGFLMAQVAINLILVFEVVIRLISQKEKFFDHWSNIFDMLVMALAVFAQLLYIHPPEVAAAAITTEEWSEMGAATFRIIRDGVLFARLYIFLKNRNKNHIAEGDEIDFSIVSDDRPLLASIRSQTHKSANTHHYRSPV